MFQGMGRDTDKLNREFGFDPTEIDLVVLSHAHIDHCGLLPKLVKEGFTGKIYCTEATAALTAILLRDSAHIQEMDTRFSNKIKQAREQSVDEPLYTAGDVQAVLPKLKALPYNVWTDIAPNVRLYFTDAGHIIGSACVHLELRENSSRTRTTFSGDVGRYGDPILKSPGAFPQADYIILESTYGDRLHPHTISPADELLQIINETCVTQKGKLIIPAFSVGRTQELLYALNQLSTENRLPPIAYYVDSPLSVETTTMLKRFPELYNSRVQDLLKKDDDPFAFPGLTMIEDVEASKALNFKKEPCVIISASGMAEAGRVKHHIANNIESADNTILIVGYCEPTSLGGRLRAGAKEVSIFGRPFSVKARVGAIESLSAHGDYEGLSQWLSCQDPRQVKKVFLVHGEYEVQQQFANRLLKKGFDDVLIPRQHELIGLGNGDR